MTSRIRNETSNMMLSWLIEPRLRYRKKRNLPNGRKRRLEEEKAEAKNGRIKERVGEIFPWKQAEVKNGKTKERVREIFLWKHSDKIWISVRSSQFFRHTTGSATTETPHG